MAWLGHHLASARLLLQVPPAPAAAVSFAPPGPGLQLVEDIRAALATPLPLAGMVTRGAAADADGYSPSFTKRKRKTVFRDLYWATFSISQP